MNDETVSDQKQKPALDETALDRLLEAAFVLQEHNREQQQVDLSLELQSHHLREQDTTPAPTSPSDAADESASQNDYTVTLAQIVEAQRQIQVHHLQLEAAMALVVERITAITHAAGAAVGVLKAKKVGYRAVTGKPALPLGTEVPMEKALCLACLKVGQVIRCADVNTEFLFDVEECRRRGIQSLIAVPIFHDGEISGGLELFFATPQAFTEQDVHSCQLMAGLITEAFSRNDEISWKQSLAAERATMLSALEKLKPNLAALVGGPATATAETSACRNCGHELAPKEQFCGKCGSPRVKNTEDKDGDRDGDRDGGRDRGRDRGRDNDAESASLENKLAAMLHAPAPANNSASIAPAENIPAASTDSSAAHTPADPLAEPAETLSEDLLASLHASFENERSEPGPAAPNLGDELPGELTSRLTEPDTLGDAESESDSDSAKENPEAIPVETTLVKSDQNLTWTSAAKAREALELMAAGQNKTGLARFWNARRGDIYLAAAVILVAVVIRWAIWSNHSVSATGGPTAAAGHRRPAPDADLSILDRMLISVGLADPPETPEYHGNPDTQVWVDLHTALYYCPGTDLYGKTPKGKYTTQRDAQLDQFEPASRKACD